MFMGPFEQAIPWDTKGIVGAKRFLEKIYVLAHQKEFSKKENSALKSLISKTIKKVGDDIEMMKFNTAISSLMILVNNLFENQETLTKENIKNLLMLLFPFAPHLAEELWQKVGFKGLCSDQKWPKYNEKLIKEEKAVLVVQINGKFRDRIEVSRDINQNRAEGIVLQAPKIKNLVGSSQIKKIIFVPNKLINIVL